MTRLERLMATLEGRPVDRPPVSFYEVGGWKMTPQPDNEFAVWNDPSWRPLERLCEEESDIIRMMSPKWNISGGSALDDMTKIEIWREGDCEFTRKTIEAPNRTLTSLTRRDVDTYTVWHLKHLLSDIDDIKAYLELPLQEVGDLDISELVEEEEALGDAGIVMVDTHDPICEAAGLFSMEDYTICALTEQSLFQQLLERTAHYLFERCEKICHAFPGHLWRVVGAEYAAEPYLPPYLYEDYVVR